MIYIRVYRHPDCAKCARLARVHEALDWRHRLETSTATPPTGPLRMGEVVVEEIATGRMLRGANALALICRHVPLYAPLQAVLRISFVRARVDRDMSGRSGGGCDLDSTHAAPPQRRTTQ